MWVELIHFQPTFNQTLLPHRRFVIHNRVSYRRSYRHYHSELNELKWKFRLGLFELNPMNVRLALGAREADKIPVPDAWTELMQVEMSLLCMISTLSGV